MPEDDAVEPLDPLEDEGILGDGSPDDGEPEEDAEPLDGMPPDEDELLDDELEDELLDELDDDDDEGMLGICGMDCDCCCWVVSHAARINDSDTALPSANGL